MTGTSASPAPSPFRLAYVPGATPAKWVRIWRERYPDVPLELVPVAAEDAAELLRRGDADAGLVRGPVDRTYFSAIPLYTETTVVIVPKDHLVTAADEVTAADLADEIVQHPLDDVLDWECPPGRPAFERPATTADAIELVAAGVGLLVVPQSLARLHHRRDLTYRTVTDVPRSGIVLAWPEERTTDRVDDFIGVVRGRTVNSTRGRACPEQDREHAGRDRDGRDRAQQGRARTSAGSKGGASRAKPTGGAKPSGGAKRAGKQGAGGKRKPRKRS
ncbi:LysR family transcriptional regulator substrate-binding protein [Streptomyces beihaiensis]|uniref:LysR family transcriptional regulator substrate-binding protein n=1 Tax=Streptomyces beihaiensis TaxID=2984495 RepID=A0ABT3TZZ9_9ACTN|nr:LysR family transcriptional regulator substrate-binding protein [Streptomyces beihaiensis]MCX3062643.1 LysR family transcriptional regulator substrate-binding protein [Streptomyces beihaiensis]